MLAAQEIIERQPLISQRGNFSGKVSALIQSWLPTEWWYNSPTTGGFPFAVTERSDQFHVPLGWVDLPMALPARNVSIPTTLPANTHKGLLIPRTQRKALPFTGESGPFFKQFIWRVDEVPSAIPFSTVPTKY